MQETRSNGRLGGSLWHNTPSASDEAPRFLVIADGGAGKKSALRSQRRHESAGAPFPMYTLAIDTDPLGFEAFDGAIHIAPDHQSVSAMMSNPERYGPACQDIVKHHRHLVDPETLGKGARTSRILTQVGFELYDRQIVEGLRKAMQALLQGGRGGRIQPVVLTSLGGGTGSTALILLPEYFSRGAKKDWMTLGLSPEAVANPVAFVIDPYIHALQQTNDVSPDWILGNIYATRVELAELEKQGKGYEYVFHLGLGNDAGAVFASIDQVCDANGLIAWEWMAAFPEFKGRAVDGLDHYKHSCRYRGDDLPERVFPESQIPPYGDNGSVRDL